MKSTQIINIVGATGAAMVASSPLVSLSALAAETPQIKDNLALTSAAMATGGIALSVSMCLVKYNDDDD